MIRKRKEEIQWLEFELFSEIPCLVHGVFLRYGGVSLGISQSPYSGLHVGDRGDPKFFEENRMRIQKIIGCDHLVSAHQVHGKGIALVDGPTSEIPDCDAMISDRLGLGLMIKHADCQAAVFFDPMHKVIANVHCGWRGNVQNIYACIIAEMKNRYASQAQDILVGISPSLGPEKSEFVNYRNELPESFLPYQIKPMYFDLWAIARMQLEAAGILSHHIEIASICTYSHPEDFFSYRRDKNSGGTGNHASVICLKT